MIEQITGNKFRSIVKGKNIVTPDILGFYRKGEYDIELSSGSLFSGTHKGVNDLLYGVTVVNTITKNHEHELSKCFDNKKSAIKYMETL